MSSQPDSNKDRSKGSLMNSKARVTNRYFPIASPAIGPLIVAAGGLFITEQILSGAGDYFTKTIQYVTFFNADRSPYIFDAHATLHVFLVFSTFLFTNVIAIFSVLFCATLIWRNVNCRKYIYLSTYLSIIIVVALFMADNGIPEYKNMAGDLFEFTVFEDLRRFSLETISISTFWSTNTLDAMIKLSNISFVFAASFTLYATHCTALDFKPGNELQKNIDKEAARSRTQLKRVQRNLAALLILSTFTLTGGLINMIVWRFWPLAYLPVNDSIGCGPAHGHCTNIRDLYSGIACGSIVMQGAVFTALIAAIFARPFFDLVIRRTPSGSTSVLDDDHIPLFSAFSRLWHLLLPLSPLATALVSIAIPNLGISQ